MENQLYAPPAANLDSTKTSNFAPAFFVVSKRKFVWMFFMTIGLYQYLWYYKNWSHYKQLCKIENHADKTIWPFPRALFTIFFVHALFYKVEDYAAKHSRSAGFPVDAVATPIVLLMIVGAILDRLAANGIGGLYTGLSFLVFLVPMYFLTERARNFVNETCDDKEGKGNAEFTPANYAWMAIGIILLILIIIGTLFPETAGEQP